MGSSEAVRQRTLTHRDAQVRILPPQPIKRLLLSRVTKSPSSSL